MTRFARFGFIFASVVFLFTGVAHNLTQYFLMSTDALITHMDGFGPVVDVANAQVSDLFRGLSYLMGFFAFALGAANLAGLFSQPKGSHPNRAVAVVNIAMLACITWSGILFLGPMQYVGGPVGMVMFGLTLLPARKT